MTLITKAQSPNLWSLVIHLSWSGGGSVTQDAVKITTTHTPEELAEYEKAIEPLTAEERELFGSGFMIEEYGEEEFKAFILAKDLDKVNRLLNEIYEEGAFISA